MVQMGDNASCARAMSNLNSCYIFDCKLSLGSVHVCCTGYLIVHRPSSVLTTLFNGSVGLVTAQEFVIA